MTVIIVELTFTSADRSLAYGSRRRAILFASRREYICQVKAKEKSQEPCMHLDQIRDVAPSAEGCEDCLKSGDSWVHLRLCLTSGLL